MKIIKMNCANCNGQVELKAQEGQKMAFCPYCGQKYMIDEGKMYIEVNQNINHNINIRKTERKIDEADVIRAKNEEKVIRARTKYEDKQNEKMLIKMGFSLIGIMFVLMVVLIIWQGVSEAIKNVNRDGVYIAPLSSSFEYKWDNYVEVVDELENAGFTNITTIDLDDASFFKKENTISKVVINGEDEFSTDDEFLQDVEIVVYYH